MSVKSKRALQLFHIGYNATRAPALQWFHESVRHAYLHAVLPMIQNGLNLGIAKRERVRVEARNSSKQAHQFNAFRSDLDVAIVFPESAQSGSVAMIIERYAKLRARLPFLGELEIYSGSEWQRRSDLTATFGTTIDLIHAIRKISWCEQAAAQYQDTYHCEKSHAAIERILVSNGIRRTPKRSGNACFFSGPIEACAQRLLPLNESRKAILISKAPIHHSQFLECSFGPKARTTAGELALTEHATKVLLAILPDEASTLSANSSEIMQLRSLGELSAHARAIAEYEWILCQSVRRCANQLDPVREHWISHLEQQMRCT